MTDNELTQLLERAGAQLETIAAGGVKLLEDIQAWQTMKEQIYQELSVRHGNPNLQAETMAMGFIVPLVGGLAAGVQQPLESFRAQFGQYFTGG